MRGLSIPPPQHTHTHEPAHRTGHARAHPNTPDPLLERMLGLRGPGTTKLCPEAAANSGFSFTLYPLARLNPRLPERSRSEPAAADLPPSSRRSELPRRSLSPMYPPLSILARTLVPSGRPATRRPPSRPPDALPPPPSSPGPTWSGSPPPPAAAPTKATSCARRSLMYAPWGRDASSSCGPTSATPPRRTTATWRHGGGGRGGGGDQVWGEWGRGRSGSGGGEALIEACTSE